MIFWAIAATVVAVIFIILFILYRRQVRKTCCQLAFLKSHQTNLRLTSGLPFRELDELVDGMNEIIDLSREIQQNSRQSESHLKETVTNLSHDIRTPLTSLDGYFQLLLKSESEEERQRYIAIIQTRIGSLKDMLEELFTYTRLQDDGYELELKPLDFGACVYSTVFSFYEDFQKKGIEPHTDFCDGHLLISGNEEAIRRAVQNLIKNALEHGGTQISFVLFRKDGFAGFQCSNRVTNGEKIDIGQVFQRFYKADSARTHTSAGLGLAIARGLVEKMGGTIAAELKDDIFIVTLQFPCIDFPPRNGL